MELSITLTTSQCSLYIGVSRSCNSLPRTRGGSDSQDGRDPHQQPTRRDSAQPDQAITGNGFSDLSTCFQLRAGSGALPVPSRLRSGSQGMALKRRNPASAGASESFRWPGAAVDCKLRIGAREYSLSQNKLEALF